MVAHYLIPRRDESVVQCSRNRQGGRSILLLLALALSIAFGWTSAAADDLPQTIPVSQTYNHAPFSYRILSREVKAGFSVYRLSYPSPVVTQVPQNNTIPAEYYLPSGIRPGDPRRPAVICLHILDGNMELVRATCSVLASRGVPAMLFMLPYYGPRAPPGGPQAMAGDPQLFLTALDQAGETSGGRWTFWPRGRRSIRGKSASRASAWAGSWRQPPPAASLGSPGQPWCSPAATF